MTGVPRLRRRSLLSFFSRSVGGAVGQDGRGLPLLGMATMSSGAGPPRPPARGRGARRPSARGPTRAGEQQSLAVAGDGLGRPVLHEGTQLFWPMMPMNWSRGQ